MDILPSKVFYVHLAKLTTKPVNLRKFEIVAAVASPQHSSPIRLMKSHIEGNEELDDRTE